MKHIKPVSKAAELGTAEILSLVVSVLSALVPVITALIGKDQA